MKRQILFFVLVINVVGGAFALPSFRLSTGIGGYFTGQFGGGYERMSRRDPSNNLGSETVQNRYLGGGVFMFFDATYAELSVGYWGGGGSRHDQRVENNPYYGYSSVYSYDFSCIGLDLGLLLKYPFAVSGKFSAFPLLGINYRVMLDEDIDVNKGGNEFLVMTYHKASDLNTLWFRLGGGFDFYFTDSVFLRTEAIYGLVFANKYEKDEADKWNRGDGESAETHLGHGVDIRLAVGYRF